MTTISYNCWAKTGSTWTAVRARLKAMYLMAAQTGRVPLQTRTILLENMTVTDIVSAWETASSTAAQPLRTMAAAMATARTRPTTTAGILLHECRVEQRVQHHTTTATRQRHSGETRMRPTRHLVTAQFHAIGHATRQVPTLLYTTRSTLDQTVSVCSAAAHCLAANRSLTLAHARSHRLPFSSLSDFCFAEETRWHSDTRQFASPRSQEASARMVVTPSRISAQARGFAHGVSPTRRLICWPARHSINCENA